MSSGSKVAMALASVTAGEHLPCGYGSTGGLDRTQRRGEGSRTWTCLRGLFLHLLQQSATVDKLAGAKLLVGDPHVDDRAWRVRR